MPPRPHAENARDIMRRILPETEEAIAQTRAAWDRELERRDAVGFAIDTLRAAYPGSGNRT